MFNFKKWVLNQAFNYSKRTIIVTLFLTALIGSGIQFIFLDDNVMNMLPSNIDSRRIWDEITEEFKYTDFLFVAFGNTDKNILNSDALSLVWDFSEKFKNLLYVDEVISIATIKRIDSNNGFLDVDDLMPHKNLSYDELQLITNYLNDNSSISSRIISKNNDFTSIVLRPKNNIDFSKFVSAVYDITRPYENQYEFHFGGQPHLTGAIPGLIKSETRQLILFGIFIMAMILLVNIRSVVGLVIIFSLIFLSALAMMGFMGWVYYFTNSPKFYFSMINTSMPIVLLTIANSDGVHIISRFFKEVREHKDIRLSISNTMGVLLLPIFLTSLTTTAAFLTMIFSPISSMMGYGFTIGFGIMWACLLSSTYLPAVISLIKWDLTKSSISKPSILERLINTFSQKILYFPKRVLFFGLLIVVFSSIGIYYINVEVNIINLFKPGNELRESTLFLDREMAGSMNLTIKVEGDIKNPEVLNKMVDTQNFLAELSEVNTTYSIANIIKEMHKSIMDGDPKFEIIPETREKINNLFTMYSISGDPDDFESLIDYEYKAGLLTAMMQSISTKEIVDIVNKIEKHLDKNRSENFETEISGMLIFLKDFTGLVVQSSINSILFSVIIIFFIAGIFYRHWKFGLLSIIPLISAIILNFGLMGWFGIDLTHFSALLTSIIIGVGVDFSIHYISNFIHYIKSNGKKDIISKIVVEDVGYPILLDVFSNMAFAALIVSSLTPLIHMGGLMVFAMISTSIGTLTILASIMEIYKNSIFKIGIK